MSKTHFVVLSCLCLGLTLLAAPALATETAEAGACLAFLEPMVELQDGDVPGEPGEPVPACDPDDEFCCDMFPDADGCLAAGNVWCCKPNDDGTDQQCKKIKRSKCLAAPAGTVHPSQNACNRNC